MKILLIALSVASASLSKLHRLIESARGNRFVKINGREVPRALFDAIESHREIIKIVENTCDADDRRFVEVLKRIQSLPNRHQLSDNDISFIRENSRQAREVQREIHRAVLHAFKTHKRLSDLCNINFPIEKHWKLLEEREKLDAINLENMITSFTVQSVEAFTRCRYGVKLLVVSSISETLSDVRLKYAVWFHPRITLSKKRLKKSASLIFDASMKRVEKSDSDERRACHAMLKVGMGHVLGVTHRLKGGLYLGDNEAMNEAVLALLRQQTSQWYWRLDSSSLFILVRALAGNLKKGSVQEKKWIATRAADAMVRSAEKEKTALGAESLDVNHSLSEAEEFSEFVIKKAKLVENILFRRKLYRSQARAFLASSS